MAVASGQVTCGTSATKLCTAGESGIVITASVTGVSVGGPGVTTSTGLPVPATPNTLTLPGARTVSSLSVPAGADNTCDYYVVSAAGGQTVTFVAPQGG